MRSISLQAAALTLLAIFILFAHSGDAFGYRERGGLQKRAPTTPGSITSQSPTAQPSQTPGPSSLSSAVGTIPTSGSGSNISASASVSSGGNSTAPGNSTVGSPLPPVTPTATSAGNGLPTSASFSNDVPPGSITWKTPVPNQTFPPLYKANANISFQWAYDTNLRVSPVSLTLAAVGPNKATWIITAMPGMPTSAYWDTGNVPPISPLMEGYYTIQLHDQRGPTAWPSPGWLYPDNRLTIALYFPQTYVPISDGNTCPTCFAGALGFRETILPLMTTFGIASVVAGMLLVGLLK